MHLEQTAYKYCGWQHVSDLRYQTSVCIISGLDEWYSHFNLSKLVISECIMPDPCCV